MGFNPTLETETLTGNEDLSWLKARKGMDTCRPIMLDVSAFAAAHVTGKGALPSGTVLGKITASGKYGPYTGGGTVNAVQTLTVDATAGTFTITFDGETTAAIAFDATAAAVQAALEALPNIDPGDVTVTGGPGDSGGTTPYVITFGGQYADRDVSLMTAADVNLTGGGDSVAIAETQAGGGETTTNGLEKAAGLLFTTTVISDETGSDLATHADVAAALLWEGVVDTTKLPAFAGVTTGELDDAAKVDLPHIRFES